LNRITGLPNRHSLYARGGAWKVAPGIPTSSIHFVLVRILGIDAILDTFGTNTYEVALFLYSRAMNRVLGTDGELFHLRDQDFLWVTSLQGRSLALRIHRLERAIVAPRSLKQIRIRCRAVMGVAAFPRDGRSVSKLLARADAALRYAHKLGVVAKRYTLGITVQESQRQRMVMDLARCLEGDARYGSLEVHIQPKGHLSRREAGAFVLEVDSGEVLLRWNHPLKGVIPNGTFIPLAEEVGLIEPLGKWVIFGLIRVLRSWSRVSSGFRYAVNVSARQLEGTEYRWLLEKLVAQGDLDPKLIILELTETSRILSPQKVFENLAALKELGFKISIDDYGAGFTSQSEVKDFAFDEIKIDKSLVDDLGQNRKVLPIIRSLCLLGEDLSIPIVAEGVESFGQLAELWDAGIRFVQGFLLSKPIRAEEFFHKYAHGQPLLISSESTDELLEPAL
jgi:EAL domain-containing protein (putative c-di-GMP-specific phosphodiesterase class I)/GGDEF domain-containing protein